MQTYRHTYRHTYIHTYRHTYIHTYIHTCIHTPARGRRARRPRARRPARTAPEEERPPGVREPGAGEPGDPLARRPKPQREKAGERKKCGGGGGWEKGRGNGEASRGPASPSMRDGRPASSANNRRVDETHGFSHTPPQPPFPPGIDFPSSGLAYG